MLNSVFYDNEARCDHSVRIGNAREYTVNHSLIENGLIFQDAENNTGLVQNSIFLDRSFGQWGPTKPSKLTIQNNLLIVISTSTTKLIDMVLIIWWVLVRPLLMRQITIIS